MKKTEIIDLPSQIQDAGGVFSSFNLQLLPDRAAGLAARHAQQDPIQYFRSLAGRYGGIDAVEVLHRSENKVQLAVVTAAAKLPLTLKRRAGTWCVALPQGYSQ